MSKDAKAEKADGQWVKHQDTGAVRLIPSKDWKTDEKTLATQGWQPCQEDGSPLDDVKK